MKIPKSSSPGNFERIASDEWISGTIHEIEYDLEHKFPAFEGKEKIGKAVRLSFALEGYKFPHKSRWMSFTSTAKSNLYLKYLLPLVDGANPGMDFDLDSLKGFKIKTMWEANGDWDNLSMLRPLGAKFPRSAGVSEEEVGVEEEEIPF